MKHSNKQHYVMNDTNKMTLILAENNGDRPNLVLKPFDTTPITKKETKKVLSGIKLLGYLKCFTISWKKLSLTLLQEPT